MTMETADELTANELTGGDDAARAGPGTSRGDPGVKSPPAGADTTHA